MTKRQRLFIRNMLIWAVFIVVVRLVERTRILDVIMLPNLPQPWSTLYSDVLLALAMLAFVYLLGRWLFSGDQREI